MKRQRQKLFRVVLAGVLMIFSFMVYAQERIVTGKVYDSSGESIIGASVMVQGTMQGVVTDIDGAFQLKVQPSQSLVISFLGYQDVILPVGSKNNFKIILEEDSKKLDEVVVVGYATQKKVNLTGSVASVSAKDIQDIPVANTTTLLQGRLPGLVLTQNGAQAGNDNPEITWMSSDETVAIVNGGVVTALKEGTTKITAICGSESAECDVTVVNSEANKLQISNEVLELNVSTNKTYTLTATKPGVDNLEVVWHSSDETVATVDGGVVTALKKGVCDITATYNGETVTCKLTVIDDNVIDLKSGNKQAAIDNAGNWNYLADGKSSVSATPTYNQKDNEINIDVSKVATADKKYVYLRYQPTESGEYKVTLTINYVGEGVASIEISGGSATAVTSDLENGENKIEFTFTVDSKTPFQIKFKSEGNFVITPVFEKITK